MSQQYRNQQKRGWSASRSGKAGNISGGELLATLAAVQGCDKGVTADRIGTFLPLAGI